jgi:quinol monooxygenase YgiN
MTARSVLYLKPKPGCRAALIDVFVRLDVPGNAMKQDGCLSVELQALPAEMDDAAPLLVTALWTHRAAYDGWLANPWRAESTAAIEPLLMEEPHGVVYDVILAAGDPVAARSAIDVTCSDD